MAAFAALPLVGEVIARGDDEDLDPDRPPGCRSTCGWCRPSRWGAALQYFTGSKAHNVRVREIAVRKDLKLSEYGLFDADDGELIVSETEEEVYERLGLPWIPPTLREDRGEIDAALHGALPDLVTEARHPRRPAHPHQPDRRGGHAGGDARRRAAARLRATTRSPTTPRTCPCSG